MSQPITKTPEQVLADLRLQPGINPTKLQPGDKVLLETTQGVYEFEIERPELGVVWVTGTDARFRQPVRGRLAYSVYDLEGTIRLDDWIGKNLRLHIIFANATFVCSIAVSASVTGDGWQYRVF